MRLGLFPGQIEELRRLAQIGVESERRSRRQLIASAAAVVMVGAGAFLLGQVTAKAALEPAAAQPEPVDRQAFLRSKLPLARRLANGPDAELLASYATFLVIFGGAGGDPVLWRGFDRLARMALANRDSGLARGLLQAASLVDTPSVVQDLIRQLRGLAR